MSELFGGSSGSKLFAYRNLVVSSGPRVKINFAMSEVLGHFSFIIYHFCPNWARVMLRISSVWAFLIKMSVLKSINLIGSIRAKLMKLTPFEHIWTVMSNWLHLYTLFCKKLKLYQTGFTPIFFKTYVFWSIAYIFPIPGKTCCTLTCSFIRTSWILLRKVTHTLVIF